MIVNDKSILVLGRPNSGKTVFSGQLYGRLQNEEGKIKLLSIPRNITPIVETLNRLENGDLPSHTPSDKKHDISLSLKYDNINFNLLYPDYGGEQINDIIHKRRLNSNWLQMIEDSELWLLFIRIQDIDFFFDLSKKIKTVEKGNKKDNSTLKSLSDQVFFIELLQMLLFHKGIGLKHKTPLPKLCIVLSCWDEIKNRSKYKPFEILQLNLPLLYEFINSKWGNGLCNIYGLSSLGFSLEKKDNQEKYRDDGPEDYGYIIMDDGKKINDLTLLLTHIVDS